MPANGVYGRGQRPKVAFAARETMGAGFLMSPANGSDQLLFRKDAQPTGIAKDPRCSSSARIFTPTHPPYFFGIGERIGAGGMQHSYNGAVLASTGGAGRGRRVPGPSPALISNYTSSPASTPSAEPNGAGVLSA